MSEKAKIVISTTKKGFSGEVIFENGKKAGLPPYYILDMSLNGKECEVFRENGLVKKVLVDSQELPSKQKPSAPAQNKGGYNQNRPNNFQQNRGYSGTFNNDRGNSGVGNHQNKTPDDSFNIAMAQIPKDTREHFSKADVNIDNFYLKLNRFARLEEGKNKKFIFFKKERINRENIHLEIKPDFGNINCSEIIKRQKAQLSSFCNYKEFETSTDSRMVVGLGHESVYETSLTLHHIYGVPYIPASTVKGIVRSWIISECFKSEEDALENKDFCKIFGSQDRQGKIIFFDAFPANKVNIEVDIMNPHYSDYYQGKEKPVDYLKPVPIPFLTVGKDTRFNFFIGTKKSEELKSETDKLSTPGSELLETAYLWMKKALTEHGVGAKTAVGYGYMK